MVGVGMHVMVQGDVVQLLTGTVVRLQFVMTQHPHGAGGAVGGKCLDLVVARVEPIEECAIRCGRPQQRMPGAEPQYGHVIRARAGGAHETGK